MTEIIHNKWHSFKFKYAILAHCFQCLRWQTLLEDNLTTHLLLFCLQIAPICLFKKIPWAFVCCWVSALVQHPLVFLVVCSAPFKKGAGACLLESKSLSLIGYLFVTGKFAFLKAIVVGDPKPTVTWSRANGELLFHPNVCMQKYDEPSREHTLEVGFTKSHTIEGK